MEPEAPGAQELGAMETPMEDDFREVEFDREDTCQSRYSRTSAFSLEDEDPNEERSNYSRFTQGSLISVQSNFSLEDDIGVGGPIHGGAEPGSYRVRGSTVMVNLYDLGNVVGALNRMVLSSMGMGVFHCAVEAYNLEWSFVFHKDLSKSSRSTGVIQNKPQRLKNYNFKQSIEVGWTDWSEEEVRKLARRLAHQWRAKSYHVTRRNCITFAEEFVTQLGLASQFPAWVKKAPQRCQKSPALSAVVNTTWAKLVAEVPTCEVLDGEIVEAPGSERKDGGFSL